MARTTPAQNPRGCARITCIWETRFAADDHPIAQDPLGENRGAAALFGQCSTGPDINRAARDGQPRALWRFLCLIPPEKSRNYQCWEPIRKAVVTPHQLPQAFPA